MAPSSFSLQLPLVWGLSSPAWLKWHPWRRLREGNIIGYQSLLRNNIRDSSVTLWVSELTSILERMPRLLVQSDINRLALCPRLANRYRFCWIPCWNSDPRAYYPEQSILRTGKMAWQPYHYCGRNLFHRLQHVTRKKASASGGYRSHTSHLWLLRDIHHHLDHCSEE